MDEKEKMLNGIIYDAMDKDLIQERNNCKVLCYKYNNLLPVKEKDKEKIIKQIIGKIGSKFIIEQPFHCDYGYNILIGENFYANYNLVILDSAKVEFGENVFIGPNCSFCTPEHPIEAVARNEGKEYAKSIKIGNNVWFGSNVVVLGGVTIGDNTVIGAGSVVTRNIPSNVIAIGNPCKILRNIESDNNV